MRGRCHIKTLIHGANEMNETPFEQFIALVQVDQKINALNSSIQSFEKKNKENKQLEESHQQSLEKVKDKLHDMKKEVDSKELEMKILDQQEADKKNKLDHVSNHKEYQLIKAEIDILKQGQHNLEEDLMTAWNQLENAKKESEIAQKTFQEQSLSLQQESNKNLQEIEKLKEEIKILIDERLHKEKGLPEEWLEKYAIMRARVNDPVVPVFDGNCSACFYKISVQDMQFLKHRKLIQCKDCFRLLYLEGAHASGGQTAS